MPLPSTHGPLPDITPGRRVSRPIDLGHHAGEILPHQHHAQRVLDLRRPETDAPRVATGDAEHADTGFLQHPPTS
jgi:hypothetical protein